jgi:hypothetical protein
VKPRGAVMASVIEHGVDGVDAPPWMVSGGTLDGERPMFEAERGSEPELGSANGSVRCGRSGVGSAAARRWAPTRVLLHRRGVLERQRVQPRYV